MNFLIQNRKNSIDDLCPTIFFIHAVVNVVIDLKCVCVCVCVCVLGEGVVRMASFMPIIIWES